MNMIDRIGCTCNNPPFYYQGFTKTMLGIDMTNGRYGEVSTEECTGCGQKWLHYFVEYESFSKSGRWYRGIVSEEDLLEITPENAIQYIERLDWYIFGGSYFESSGTIGSGQARVDL